MYIIDESQFVKDILIDNTSVDVSDVDNPFEYWIDTEARFVLRSALGQVNFNALNSDIDDNGDLVDSPAAKHTLLVDGEIYTHKGKSYEWIGLKYNDGAVPRSLLADFVWCKHYKDQQSQAGAMGEMVGQSANSMSVSGAARYTQIWNRFVQQYQGRISLASIVYNYDVEKQYQDTRYVSLLQYLIHKADDFPDAALKVFKKTNRFSL